MVSKDEIIKELKEKPLVNCQIVSKLDSQERANQATHCELTQAIFENIKQFREGWTFKNIITVKNHRILDYDWQGKEKLLIHQSAKLEYNNEGILKFNPQNILTNTSFSSNQWKELEQLIPLSTEQQAEEQGNNDWWPKIKTPLLVTSLVLGASSLIFLIYQWAKKYS